MSNETLLNLLRTLNITTLFICGIHSERCLTHTEIDAHSKGYNTIIISDGHSTISTKAKNHQEIVKEQNLFFKKKGIFVKSTSRVLSLEN